MNHWIAPDPETETQRTNGYMANKPSPVLVVMTVSLLLIIGLLLLSVCVETGEHRYRDLLAQRERAQEAK